MKANTAKFLCGILLLSCLLTLHAFAATIEYSFLNKENGIADGAITVNRPEEFVEYNTAYLFFGNSKGILKEHTAIAVLDVTNGSAIYTIKGRRLLAEGATNILVYFQSSDGATSPNFAYQIPDYKQFKPKGNPLFSFAAISDIHVGSHLQNATENRDKALSDVSKHHPDFVMINGDLTNRAQQTQFETVRSYLTQYFKKIPVFLINGNHDVSTRNPKMTADHASLIQLLNDQINLLRRFGYEMEQDGDHQYYATYISGYHYIFLSVPDPTTEYGGLGEKQRAFLEEQLFEREQYGVPTFVACHFPISYLADQIEVEKILNRHKNVIFISGHTHKTLDSDFSTIDVGTLTDSMVQVNDACCIWLNLWSADGTGNLKDENGITVEDQNNCMGVYAQVYRDKIILKARNFVTGQDVSKALYLITLPKTASIGTATISGTPSFGKTLEAKLNRKIPNSSYRCEWYIKNNLIATGTKFAIPDYSEYADAKVSLRIIDENGVFASDTTNKKIVGNNPVA